jgi:hypothetical protein
MEALTALDPAQLAALESGLGARLAAVEEKERLATDLEFFARVALRLRPKMGPVSPFIFNDAQRQLHNIVEEQRAKLGRVRIVVLKARQLGVSTYVAARLYRKTIHSPGFRTIILGHEKRASSNLYQMVRRFHDNMPDELKPSVGISNAEELIFDKIDSGYIVSVATTEGAGRSATAQALHASEAAFWPDLPAQFAALLQTVPDRDGTEIILETTANGYNDFHKLWRKAEAGESDFIPVFLAWSLDPEYRRKPDEGFTVSGEEKRLMELHDLDLEQICWRRAKIGQLGSEEYFRQEYPLHAGEAFIASDFDSFIPVQLVLEARKAKVEAYGGLELGVDPAGTGADRTAIAWRRGHAIYKIETRRGLSTMEIAGWVADIIRKDKPARVNIDIGGMGVGVADRLLEQGYDRHLINGINFGGKPVTPPPFDETGKPGGGPANRRAELWCNLKAALETGRFSLPDRDSLQSDLCSVGYKYTSDGRLLLEAKQDMRRRGVPSPDEGDACALTLPATVDAPVRPAWFSRDLSKLYRDVAY